MNATYRWFAAIMIGIAIMGGFVIYRARRYGIDKQVALARAAVKPSKSAQSGQIYNNDKIGVRLTLSNDFLAHDYSPISVVIVPQTQSTEQSPTRFIYMTVVRPDVPGGTDNGLNYSEQMMKRLYDMKIGQVSAVNKKTGEDEWYSFQRLQNRSIDGVDMHVYVNEKPLGYPRGTTEYRFIGQRGGRIIVAGGYVGTTGDPDLDYKKMDVVISNAIFGF